MAAKNKDRNLFGGGGRSGSSEAPAPGQADRELALEIDDIERSIDELRATYELFFMGIERLEPSRPRDKVKARLRRLADAKPRNTALKFRMQQVKARLVALENHWQRQLRQRESGTLRQDKARLERRERERIAREAAARASGPTEPAEAKSDPSWVSTSSIGSAPSASTSGSGSPRPRATSAADLTDEKLRRIYETFVGARRRCGESTDLRYDDMATALRKQVPTLLARSGARSVEFKVVIRGGKAVLKALPRG